jgi:hypothetical protein
MLACPVMVRMSELLLPCQITPKTRHKAQEFFNDLGAVNAMVTAEETIELATHLVVYYTPDPQQPGNLREI